MGTLVERVHTVFTMDEAWECLLSTNQFDYLDNRHDSALVALSQIALETGHGKFCYNWNVINIKADLSYQREREYYIRDVKEELSGGIVRIIKAGERGSMFRSYSGLQHGIDWALSTIFVAYCEAWDEGIMKADPARYAEELKKRYYYSASLDSYREAMVSLFNTFSKRYAKN